jgi:MFS family permease
VQNKLPSRRYGYIVLLSCFLIMVLVYGSKYCFGVFFKPMIADFGWTRAATSGPFSLFMIVSGTLAIVSGRLSDRFGPRVIITVSSLIFGTGYILMSRIGSLWQFYLIDGLIVAAGSAGMYTPLVALIARWFPRKKGLTAGIGISGIGFGIGVMPVLASALIVAFNWRKSMFIVGVVCLVTLVFLAQLLKKAPAQNKRVENESDAPFSLESKIKEFSFGEALKTSSFWLFFVTWFCYGFFFQLALVHIVPYATDVGMTVTAAATILTVIGLVGFGARIGLGYSGDRFGHKTIVMISFAALALAYTGLALNQSVGIIYIFGVVYGCFSGIGILLAPITAEFFGYKSLGALVGTLIMANALGGALSPPLAGAIFDHTGSYQWAFAACAILGLASVIMMYLLNPPPERRNK